MATYGLKDLLVVQGIWFSVPAIAAVLGVVCEITESGRFFSEIIESGKMDSDITESGRFFSEIIESGT